MSDPLDAADDFSHASPHWRQRSNAIERAVAAERERCAKIADQFANNAERRAAQHSDVAAINSALDKEQAGRTIAAAIREPRKRSN